jgi:hypothetical protein
MGSISDVINQISQSEVGSHNLLIHPNIESLQIYDHSSVKCQKCGNAIPIVGKLPKPHSNRVVVLQRRIGWLKGYHRCHHRRHHYHYSDDVVKELERELADLLAEDAKADKLRHLPLYSCRITGFKFVCSKCYDRVYNNTLLQKA